MSRINSKPVAAVFFTFLVALYLQLAWNARYKILQGNSDFIIYYTAIQMVKEGQGNYLYDLSLATAYQQRILDSLQASLNVPDPFRAGLLFFVNPPIALVWFVPFTALSYLNALLVWNLFSLGCYIAGVMVLLTTERRLEIPAAGLVVLACLAFPPVFVTLLQGQVSSLLFLGASLVYRSLKHGKDWQAGVWLCVLLTKFQLLLPFLALFLWRRQWKVLRGFLVGSIVAFGVSLSLVGPAGVAGYVRLAREMLGWVNHMGMNPGAMHCLRGQFNSWWHPNHAVLAMFLTAVCSLALVVLLIRVWRNGSEADFDLRYSLLIVVSVLISPHLYVHDLSLLLIPGLLLYQFANTNALELTGSTSPGAASEDSDTIQLSPPRNIQKASGRINSFLAHVPVGLFVTGFPLLWLAIIVSRLLPIQLSVWALIAWSVLLAAMIESFQAEMK